MLFFALKRAKTADSSGQCIANALPLNPLKRPIKIAVGTVAYVIAVAIGVLIAWAMG
ncbi:MAG: hypothetical protein ACI3YK_03285 [Eubacteriales bacterium]